MVAHPVLLALLALLASESEQLLYHQVKGASWTCLEEEMRERQWVSVSDIFV